MVARVMTETLSVVGHEGRVLLFDGDCGLCTRVVQWVLCLDFTGSLRFASLQGEFARGGQARNPELKGVDSMVPASIRDRVYDWVATRRRSWFQSAPAYSIPSADHRRLL